MKKIWKGTVLIIMLIIFVGCGASNQKEAMPYSKMSELDTDSISSPEYLIKELGSPNRTITEVKDMEAIINGYIKNIEHPESKGNKVNDAVNNVSYSQLIELAEKRLEIVSSFVALFVSLSILALFLSICGLSFLGCPSILYIFPNCNCIGLCHENFSPILFAL